MAKTSPENKAFQEAYSKLNDPQREAVDSIEGPVMVIAGPGTGKTEILALRIGNILKLTDSRPENILALTFTDAAAHNMRERLGRYIGSEAYQVAIHTFHSFAGELIRNYPDAYPALIGGRPAGDIERLHIIESIVASGNFKLLRPHGDPLYYVKELPRAIAELKKEYITPEVFAARIADEEKRLLGEEKFHQKGAHKGKVKRSYLLLEQQIEKHRELLLAYQLYQAALREQRLFDFEDMIVESVKALQENEPMLRDLQETYHYILADEHQDVNESQNKILELLADYHDQPNLFVVGDEKQAIFRFQGASLDNFLFFQERFPHTKVISLTDNYRSTKNILDVAHQIIAREDEALSELRLPLRAAGESSAGKIECRRFSHEAIEDEWLVGEIKAALTDGKPPEEIAVIVRLNRDVLHFTNLLRQNGLPANPSADSDILSHPVTIGVENLLRSVVRLEDESALFECLLGPWWGIDPGDLARLFAARSGSWPLYRLIEDADKLRELKIEKPAPLLAAASTLQEARQLSATITPHQVLNFLLKQSGCLDHLMNNDPIEGTRVLRRIYDDLEEMVIEQRGISLREAVRLIEYRRQHGLPLKAPFIIKDRGAIQVMTAHKAKGLEFATVFIPRANDKNFGRSGKRDLFKLPLLSHTPLEALDEEDDERRLFYVALTRAKNTLLISSSDENRAGKLLDPSRFLVDLPEQLLPRCNTDQAAADFKSEDVFQTAPDRLKLEPSIIRELFLARGFSVTHLNNYLEDPQKYYYENLLRRPQPRALSLLYGEVVHEVLERSANSIVTHQKRPSDSELSNWLNTALGKLPLSKTDEASLHERAYKALLIYVPRLEQSLTPRSKNELTIKVELTTNDPALPEIPLTGKLDRIDYDEEGGAIRVVDYKTGKPKSRNEIAGTTKNSDGRYKRQLIFYALLLSLYAPDRPLPKEFVLSFVEPKSDGTVAEQSFLISAAEIEALKQEVIKVAKEIISGEKFK